MIMKFEDVDSMKKVSAQEEVIATSCTSNRFLNRLRGLFIVRCMMTIQNIVKEIPEAGLKKNPKKIKKKEVAAIRKKKKKLLKKLKNLPQDKQAKREEQ